MGCTGSAAGVDVKDVFAKGVTVAVVPRNKFLAGKEDDCDVFASEASGEERSGVVSN